MDAAIAEFSRAALAVPNRPDSYAASSRRSQK